MRLEEEIRMRRRQLLEEEIRRQAKEREYLQRQQLWPSLRPGVGLGLRPATYPPIASEEPNSKPITNMPILQELRDSIDAWLKDVFTV